MKSEQTKFRKGELVTASIGRSGIPGLGWRLLSSEEREEWYRVHAEECRAGIRSPLGEDGEPVLSPRDKTIPLQKGRVYSVVRGRVRAPYHYTRIPGCVEIFCSFTGQTFFVERDDIRHLGE